MRLTTSLTLLATLIQFGYSTKAAGDVIGEAYNSDDH